MTMRARPRAFSREFKLEMVRQWESGERSGAQLVREHDLTRSLLHRWRAERRTLGEAAFTGAAVSEEDALRRRVTELERALSRANLENDVLKTGLRLIPSGSGKP